MKPENREAEKRPALPGEQLTEKAEKLRDEILDMARLGGAATLDELLDVAELCAELARTLWAVQGPIAQPTSAAKCPLCKENDPYANVRCAACGENTAISTWFTGATDRLPSVEEFWKYWQLENTHRGIDDWPIKLLKDFAAHLSGERK